MKNRNFFDLAQAQSYLRHTLITIDKKPAFIWEVTANPKRNKNNDHLLSYSFLSDMNEPISITLCDEAIDMTPVSLGMVNYFYGDSWSTYYASRLPARKWKVGLCNENIEIFQINGSRVVGDMTRQIFPTKVLSKTILNQYPTFEETLKKLSRYGGYMAFSRQFAVDSRGRLYYKLNGDPVGTANKTGYSLRDEYFYLKESLEEDVARH